MASAANRLYVMLVDDSEDHLFLTKSKLEAEDPFISVVVSNSAETALDSVRKSDIDCIVSDYEMAPGMNGLEFFKELRRAGINKPFIFLTGQGNEELAREAFLNGVDDYFTKDVGFAYFTKLINAVRNSVHKYSTLKNLEYVTTFNKNIVNHMYEGFSVQGIDGLILMWSEQMKKISGIEEKDAVGKFIWDLIDTSDSNFEKIAGHTIEKQEIQNFFAKFKQGLGKSSDMQIPCKIVPFNDDNGNVIGSILLLIDPSIFAIPL